MWEWIRWAPPPCVLKTVIVNLKGDEPSIRGVLWRARGPWLVVRNAAALQPGIEPVPLDGDALVHQATVTFIQVLPE